MAETVRRSGLRPFVKGDPRINRDGRPKARATAMLRATVTEADLKAIWVQCIKDAKKGDKEARRDVFDRLEGRPVARTESGEPGDFDLDLTSWSDEEVGRAVKRLKRVT